MKLLLLLSKTSAIARPGFRAARPLGRLGLQSWGTPGTGPGQFQGPR